jgi:hypothetical protein
VPVGHRVVQRRFVVSSRDIGVCAVLQQQLNQRRVTV